MAGGRPSLYSDELAANICGQLAEGNSLRSICRNDDSMPEISCIFRWLREIPEFSKQYAKAKEESADALVEDMLDIADDGTNDWMEKKDKDGENIGWQLNGEHVQRSKLRVDVRKWAASKLKAKKYGDKLELSQDPQNPVFARVDPTMPSPEATRTYKESLNTTH